MPKVLLDTATYFDILRAKKHRREPCAINTLRHLTAYSTQHGRAGLSLHSVIEISAGFKSELRGRELNRFWK